MINDLPIALPLSAKLLADKNIPVSEIPEAIFLCDNNHDFADENKVNAQQTNITEKSTPPLINTKAISSAVKNVNQISFTTTKSQFDPTKVRSTGQFINPNMVAASAPEIDHSERLQLIKTARPETNKGRERTSRLYIRGVLHAHPMRVWFGALFALLVRITVPLGIIGSFFLLLRDQNPQSFGWVSHWYLVFPLSVFFFLGSYLITGLKAKCTVCGQKCFLPKKCLKNKKAHYIPLLGYIIPCALHVLLFRWFRCTYCGTSIRIKE
jgi:hypothetical protein